MKAIVAERYGSPDVLQVQEVAKPVPKDNEVLVKMQAASVNAADLHLLSGKPFFIRFMGFGLLKPRYKVLGAAISGEVESIGASVTRFQPGDEVVGDLSESGWGGFAEYVCASADALVLKPASVSFEDAAAVPMAAVTALQALRDRGHIHQGQKVLIHGASGGVGGFAVQIAKTFGAEVTAVCSTGNIDAARSMGADSVIDYTEEDFAKNGQEYDLIMAANGDRSISDYKRALSPNGTYVMSGGSDKQMFQAMLLGPLLFRSGTKKLAKNATAKPSTSDLAFLNGLLQAGRVVPSIDRRVPLSEAVEAIRYVGKGHAKGKVVINMGLTRSPDETVTAQAAAGSEPVESGPTA
jgi:NADPH:quinone reductase-like Zn-dependent oxidoreductase